jgi:hypothetical protein
VYDVLCCAGRCGHRVLFRDQNQIKTEELKGTFSLPDVGLDHRGGHSQKAAADSRALTTGSIAERSVRRRHEQPMVSIWEIEPSAASQTRTAFRLNFDGHFVGLEQTRMHAHTPAAGTVLYFQPGCRQIIYDKSYVTFFSSFI